MDNYTTKVRFISKTQDKIFEIYYNDKILVKTIGMRAADNLIKHLSNKERVEFVQYKRGKDTCYEVRYYDQKVARGLRESDKQRICQIMDSWRKTT